MASRVITCAALCTISIFCALVVVFSPASHVAIEGFAPQLRIEFGFRVLAAPFLIIIALVAPAVGIWSLRRGGEIEARSLTLFVLLMVAVLLAQSVAAFALAWEAMSLASAFLVAVHHEHRNVRRAVFTYLLMSQLGALCIIAALVLLGVHAQSFRFNDIAASATSVPGGVRSIVIALAVIGFGSKAGLVPLHFWLPRAHPVAPASASALLSGVMLKIAIYGLVLVLFSLAAPVTAGWGIAIMAIGAITALAGGLYAAIDNDLKRLLAYSSIENVGIIVTAIGAAVATSSSPAIAALALLAALFHCLNHAIFKSLLFLGSGSVLQSAGTVDLNQLGGLSRTLPLTAAMMLIGSMAIVGLPPFNGFASEWLVFQSLVQALPAVSQAMQFAIFGSIAALGATGGLAAAAFVKAYAMTFLGGPHQSRARSKETFDPAVIALTLLAGLCVIVGAIPIAFVRLLQPAVSAALPGVVAGSGSDVMSLANHALATLPIKLGSLPCVGGAIMFGLGVVRGMRRVPTWTCGSEVTVRSQYSATAFSKPLRLIFAFVLFPDRQRRIDTGESAWIPTRIRYHVSARYVIDEAARWTAALLQQLARRGRIVQGGLLRVYLLYALAAVAVALVAAR